MLLRTSDATREIVIWDNASTDGTGGLPRLARRPAHPRRSAATRTSARTATRAPSGETTSPYLIEIDDDVVDAPAGWDKMLRDAFVRLPEVGFLAADLEDDPNDEASRVPAPHPPARVHAGRGERRPAPPRPRRRRLRHDLARAERARRRLSRDRKEVFWLEDAAYIEDIERLGYSAAVLADLRVHHTGGPYYSTIPKEKEEYWRRYWARQARRTPSSAMLVRVPSSAASTPASAGSWRPREAPNLYGRIVPAADASAAYG